MKGKIFQESNNIYEDQARILFNYYQQAAEKIVQQEESIENEISKLENEKKSIEFILSSFWERVKLWFGGKLKKTKAEVVNYQTRIKGFQKMHSEIFRDYKVEKLGVAYVPIADQIKYGDQSFVVDYSSSVPNSEVRLQMPRQNELLLKTVEELEDLSKKAPFVETSNDVEELETEVYSRSMQKINQHDYFGKLERSLRTVSFCLSDIDTTEVSLPLVTNESEQLKFIKEFTTDEIPANAPVINVFDTKKYDSEINKFQEINNLKNSFSTKTQEFEDVIKNVMVTMADSVQAISSLKIASTNKVVMESNKILYKILKSPYNHYSPVLEASEIERIKNENFNYGENVTDYVPFNLKESSKVKYNLFADSWNAEDGSSTNFPFGVHQIQEEIVAPMVQNLMNETRIERLKIYNHIKDQKMDYLNQWHQDTEDFYGRNRAESADLINLMRASLRDFVAASNTLGSLKKTEESMAQSNGSLDATVVNSIDNSADVLAAFELQSREFQNVQTDFESFMDRLKEDIDLKAERFEHIDYYDAKLRDGNSHDLAVAASESHDLEMRRRPLISVNPLFAKTSEILPEPVIETVTYDHIAMNLPSIAKNSLEDLETPNDMHSEIAEEPTQDFALNEEHFENENPHLDEHEELENSLEIDDEISDNFDLNEDETNEKDENSDEEPTV